MANSRLVSTALAAICMVGLLAFVAWDYWRRFKAAGKPFQYYITDLWVMAVCLMPGVWAVAQAVQGSRNPASVDMPLHPVPLAVVLLWGALVGLFGGKVQVHYARSRYGSAGLLLGCGLGGAAIGCGGLLALGWLFEKVVGTGSESVGGWQLTELILWSALAAWLGFRFMRHRWRSWRAAGGRWLTSPYDRGALAVVLVPASLVTAYVTHNCFSASSVWPALLLTTASLLGAVAGQMKASLPQNRADAGQYTSSFYVLTTALLGSSICMALGLLCLLLVFLLWFLLLTLGFPVL